MYFARSCICEKKALYAVRIKIALCSIQQKQRLRIFMKLFQTIFWHTNFQNGLQTTNIFSTRKNLSEMSSSEQELGL